MSAVQSCLISRSCVVPVMFFLVKGWTSLYVNEPGEVLAWCTHQPSSLTWRIKQVLRWHQGAVQILLFKGIRYTSFGGSFPTLWHRIYAFDQATYYLQVKLGNSRRLVLENVGCPREHLV